jgi:hypothetical protein
MNPSDYFKEGSTSYVQTKQALDVINAAKAAGLPEAEQYQKDLESSISLARKSGWRDFSGFDATRKAISGLMPRVEAMSQAEGSVQNITSGIDASIGLIRSSGGNVSEETIKAIDQAKASRNPAALKALQENIGKTAQEVFKQTAMPPTDKEVSERSLAQKKLEDEKYALTEQLKTKYQDIVDAKNDPRIKSAFGMPIDFSTSPSRLIAGTEASVASAKVNRLANQEWIQSIISSKAAGATFGALSDKEGSRLSSAASLLSDPSSLNYDTANKELQKMAESVKKLYKQATGRSITEDVKTETPPPAKVDPTQSAAAYMMGIPSTLTQP